MAKETDNQLLSLKGFKFDGNTGKTLTDLYEAVRKVGGKKDSPFLAPLPIKGRDRFAVINSYLDPSGRRFHIIWQSDKSGLSEVVNVILNAPSLAKEKVEACEMCGDGFASILGEIMKD